MYFSLLASFFLHDTVLVYRFFSIVLLSIQVPNSLIKQVVQYNIFYSDLSLQVQCFA